MAASRLITLPLSQPSTIQQTRCPSHLVNPFYLRQNDFLEKNRGEKDVKYGPLLPLECRNDITARIGGSYGGVARLHTSASLLATKKKSSQTAWEVGLTNKLKAAWRGNPLYPFWSKNEFLNGWFLERFEVKRKHFIVFVSCVMVLCSLPIELFMVFNFLMIAYILKGKKL